MKSFKKSKRIENLQFIFISLLSSCVHKPEQNQFFVKAKLNLFKWTELMDTFCPDSFDNFEVGTIGKQISIRIIDLFISLLFWFDLILPSIDYYLLDLCFIFRLNAIMWITRNECLQNDIFVWFDWELTLNLSVGVGWNEWDSIKVAWV